MPARTQALTLYLIKPEYAKTKGIISTKRKPEQHTVRIGTKRFGTLYVKPPQQGTPPWLRLLQGSLDPPLDNLHNASTAAVLLTKAANRTVALTFGYGKSLLQPGTWEELFGLKVTLNSVDPDRIKSVDCSTLDAIGQHTQTQASTDARMAEFGIDIEQDILRAVTGTPQDHALGTRLTGKDALRTNVKLTIADLPILLEHYVTLSQATTYQQRYPWVDHIQEVRDHAIKKRLDERIIQKLQNNNLDRLWLAVPELINWFTIGKFTYTKSAHAKTYDDLHLNDFLAIIPHPATIDILDLKRRHVYASSNTSDQDVEQWTVYRCLYAEIEDAGIQHVLNNGTWYRVAPDFVTTVNNTINTIPTTTMSLPVYNDADEGAYNQRAATQAGGALALMDRRLVRLPGMPEGIEWCDLYSLQREMIHVKRYHGSSAAMSHLFAQGLVAATAFLREEQFRIALNGLLPATHRISAPVNRPRPGEYTVVYGIITRSPGALRLPFFSRVNLKNAYQALTDLGYGVHLARIPTAAAAQTHP